MSSVDFTIPNLYCKLCAIQIFPKENEYNLTQRGIIIAQCPTKHYTLHKILINPEAIEELGFNDWFTDFIFINGFEVQRSVDHTSQTNIWYGEHKQLEHHDRAVTDEEFLELYLKFDRLGPMK